MIQLNTNFHVYSASAADPATPAAPDTDHLRGAPPRGHAHLYRPRVGLQGYRCRMYTAVYLAFIDDTSNIK